jgi:hypothetical protein
VRRGVSACITVKRKGCVGRCGLADVGRNFIDTHSEPSFIVLKGIL